MSPLAMEQIEQLQKQLDRAESLNRRWNRAAATQAALCGGEIHDEPERVFERLLQIREGLVHAIGRKVREVDEANRVRDLARAASTRNLEAAREADRQAKQLREERDAFRLALEDIRSLDFDRTVGEIAWCLADAVLQKYRPKGTIAAVAGDGSTDH